MGAGIMLPRRVPPGNGPIRPKGCPPTECKTPWSSVGRERSCGADTDQTAEGLPVCAAPAESIRFRPAHACCLSWRRAPVTLRSMLLHLCASGTLTPA